MLQESNNWSIEEADRISLKTARAIVGIALQTKIRRGNDENRASFVIRTKEKLQTIKKVCDFVQQIKNNHFLDKTDEAECFMELDIALGQLCICDIPNLPVELNRETIQLWVDRYAEEQIEHLENCLKTAISQEHHKDRIRKRDMFINPQTRGKWLDLHFKTSPPTIPDHAIDNTGKIFRLAEEAKNIYLKEGTFFLKKKLEAPGPEEEKREYEKPPNLEEKRDKKENENQNDGSKTPIPQWWKRIYNRNAKNIPDQTWRDLLKNPSRLEIRETINKIPKDKAAGYDGVDINLIKLLTQEENSPLMEILLYLFTNKMQHSLPGGNQ